MLESGFAAVGRFFKALFHWNVGTRGFAPPTPIPGPRGRPGAYVELEGRYAELDHRYRNACRAVDDYRREIAELRKSVRALEAKLAIAYRRARHD